MWNKNCKILIMLGIIGLCAPSAFKVSGETTGTVNLAEWEYTINGDTAVLTKYKGMAKDVVIPLSGDLGTTNVKITKRALREAADAADRQSGTLTNSNNDTSGTGLVADNSTDGNPSDAKVDYSKTFADLYKITEINLSKLKIVAHDGEAGKNVQGGRVAQGENGKDGETIDISYMFLNCKSLLNVDLSSLVGQAGRGGNGGIGMGEHGTAGQDNGDIAPAEGGMGIGGNGGAAGNFYSNSMFANTYKVRTIKLDSFVGRNALGGNGGYGYGGNGGNGYGHGRKSSVGGYGGSARGGAGFAGGGATGGAGGDGYMEASAGGSAYGGNGYGYSAGGAFGGRGGNVYCDTTVNPYFGGYDHGGCLMGINGGDAIAGKGYGCSVLQVTTIGGEGGASYASTGVAYNKGSNGQTKAAHNFPASSDIENFAKYNGRSVKTNMFCPVAVNETTMTRNVGFDIKDFIKDLEKNIVALRAPSSGKGENLISTELGNVQISAYTQEGNSVTLDDVSKNAGVYRVVYSYDGSVVPIEVKVESPLSNNSIFPSSIDFGSIPIQYEKDDVLKGMTNGTSTTAKIEVVDNRSSTGKGYKIKVLQSSQLTESQTNKELIGARICFDTGTVQNSNHLTIAGGGQTIEMIPNQEIVVFQTEENKSSGTTTLPLNNFHLIVPKEARKLRENYSATLVWTFSDTFA